MIKINETKKENIKRMYLEEQKSMQEIADYYNVHKDTIRICLSKLGVSRFRGKISGNLEITNELQQILIGSLLGDGSFVYGSGRCKNCFLSIGHSEKQLEYLRYKVGIISKYGFTNKIYKYSYSNTRYKSGNLTTYYYKTNLHPIFTQIRNQSYDLNGIKRINQEFVSDIDPLGLAIWYMDDGYVTKNSCILSTCSFTQEEQRVLADILLKKFNLHFNIGKHDNSMYLQAKDFPLFVKIISPYIISCMQYKLIPYSKRVLTKQGELLEACDGNQQPSTPLTKCEGSETNS